MCPGPPDPLPPRPVHWVDPVDLERGPPLRSGGAQDQWGRAEEAGHRGPSPWGLSLGALPRPRTNRGRHTPWRHEQREALLGRGPLLIAPKVPFRNTDIEKECPLRPSVYSRPIRSPRAPCAG